MYVLAQKDRADFEEQQRIFFENMVHHKLTALQTQLDTLAVEHEEEQEQKKFFEANVNQTLNQIDSQADVRATMTKTQLRTTATSIQEKIDHMIEKEDQTEVTICKLVDQFEQCLKVIEDRSIQRLEEFSTKIAHVLKKLIHEKFEDLQCSIDAVNRHVQRLENRMEAEMRQLYHGMYKA